MRLSYFPLLRPVQVSLLAGLLSGAAACSHGTVAPSSGPLPPRLAQLEGKKVALVEVDGEDTPRRIVEVALVNQLVHRGSFELISKQDVETARAAPNQDPTDWVGIARRAGADYAMRAKVLDFTADTHQGYSEEKVHDTQLEQEGADPDTERVYKVESMVGSVRVNLDFRDVKTGEDRSGIAEAQDTVTADARTEAIHLPPKLRFMEKIANQAFQKFFDQY